MVSAVVDRGNGGPWEWRTPGMADLNQPNGSADCKSTTVREEADQVLLCSVETRLEGVDGL